MLEIALKHRVGDLDLDLALRSEARTLALFGDSGAGKTSVLNAIAGLLVPQSGRVVLDGEAEALRTNEDVKEFYLGVGGEGRKSFKDVKHYKRRKRWLS